MRLVFPMRSVVTEKRSALVVRGQQSPAWTSVTEYAAGKINTHSLAPSTWIIKAGWHRSLCHVRCRQKYNRPLHDFTEKKKKLLQSVFLAKYKRETLKSDLFSLRTWVFTRVMPFLRSRANSLFKVGWSRGVLIGVWPWHNWAPSFLFLLREETK